MSKRITRILAVSGSLRAVSYNSAALRAARHLAPAACVVHVYQGLGELPLFNPDHDAAAPAAVEEWRAQLRAADALLIASPEYAHGISGVLKNALDWAVSMPDFPGKPVALLNTSPRASHAQAALREVLTTMSARLVPAASIDLPLQGSGYDTGAILADLALSQQLSDALLALLIEIDDTPGAHAKL